jgi:hypothetical protein
MFRLLLIFLLGLPMLAQADTLEQLRERLNSPNAEAWHQIQWAPTVEAALGQAQRQNAPIVVVLSVGQGGQAQAEQV